MAKKTSEFVEGWEEREAKAKPAKGKTFEEIIAEGYDAAIYKAGQAEKSRVRKGIVVETINPYGPESLAGISWQAGYDAEEEAE